ncbi:MAG: hypothetical protein DCF22_03105 [Leptolyngbya sp.]|nr:MAG: hypothetical protein DCF22_03105 [Leptolyngbya sp.]
MPNTLLENRDYTLIVAKTAASITTMPPGYDHRWAAAHSAIVALAQTCEELDPDGITVYISSRDHSEGAFKRYEQVTPAQVDEIFQENYPPKTLSLLDGLQLALDEYFIRKTAKLMKQNGAIIIVLIDGEPLERMKIAKAIAHAADALDSDNELGIGFAHIGDDLIARGFLSALDDDLRSRLGAKFDIVHTKVFQEIDPMCLTDFLTDILQR